MSEIKTLAALGGAIAFIFLGIGAYQVMQNQDVMEMCVPGVLVLVAIPLTVWVAKTALAEIKSTADWWHNRSMALDVHRVTMEKATLDLSLVQPDLHGLLPVARQLLESGALTNQSLLLAAQHVLNQKPVQPVPNSLSYAPHMITKTDVKAEGGAPVPALPVATVQPKSFLELYQGGMLPADKFLMGFNLETGAPVTATWRDLYSSLIGGQPGSGKSTLIRLVLAQSALQGGRFVVIDPHYGAGEESLGLSLEPLRSLMLCDVASNEKEMLDALRFVADVGQRRLHGQDQDRTPVVLVVDETTALLSRSNVADELTNVLGMIAQETRKSGLFALCIGQNFKADIMDTSVRNSFVSMLSCRARKSVARVQSDNNEFAEVAESLRIGEAVWMNPNGEVIKVAVPNTTQQMIDVVARQISPKTGENSASEKLLPTLGSTPSKALPEGADGSTLEVVGKDLGSSLEVVLPTDARTKRVLQLFKSGATLHEIVQEIYGVAGGRQYQTGRSEVEAVLRDSLR